MIIRNIIYAEKPYEALQKAKDNMYFMIGDDGNAPFDYYSTLMMAELDTGAINILQLLNWTLKWVGNWFVRVGGIH